MSQRYRKLAKLPKCSLTVIYIYYKEIYPGDVNDDGAVNAALLAIEILSLGEPELEKKLAEKRAKDTATVLEKNKAIEDKYNN